MFKNLTKLNLKRNIKQAIGFFIIYGFLGLLLSSLIGGVAVSLFAHSFKSDINVGAIAGSVAGVVYGSILYYAICIKKKMISIIYIILGIIINITTFFIGIFIPLFLIAFLTTREDKSNTGFLE